MENEYYVSPRAKWVGKVPVCWDFYRGKYIFGERFEKGNDTNLELLSPTQKYGVIPQSMYDELSGMRAVKVKEDTDLSAFKTVHVGDFCISLRSFQGGFEYSQYEGVVSPAYHILFSKMPISDGYYKYLFKEQTFIAEMNSYCQSLRDGKNISYEDFGNTYIPIPPLDEQKAIADYLDDHCSKIDEIIAEATASIEEYKELKQAVIFEAVTKGLDKTVPMKDSGVEWIGEIPVHWELSRVKNECHNLDNLREPIRADNRDNKLGLYDYYGASGVIDKIDDFNVDDTVLLIGEDGANLRMRNLPLIYRASGKFWVNNHAHILKVKEERNDYSFMAYLLEAGDYNGYITGSAQPKLSQFNLMRFPIVHPELMEQVAIADYLDEIIPEYDSLISEKQALIEDLQAYKKSLIYEVVTGKRRVV